MLPFKLIMCPQAVVERMRINTDPLESDENVEF